MNWDIIDSDNGLSPDRRQAIIWTNAVILLIGHLWTNFSEILIGIQTFSLKKMQLKMSAGKWWPFCLGFNVSKEYRLLLRFSQNWYEWLGRKYDNDDCEKANWLLLHNTNVIPISVNRALSIYRGDFYQSTHKQGWGQIRFIKYKYKYKFKKFGFFKYKYKYKYFAQVWFKYKYKYIDSNTNTNTNTFNQIYLPKTVRIQNRAIL